MTSASIQRIRANKKVSVIDDVDLENTSNNLKTHRLLNRSEKILDSVGISDGSRRGIIDEGSSYKRRGLKVVTFDTDGDDSGLKKWTPIENQVSSVKARHEEVTAIRARKEDSLASIRSDSSAAIRARQSKEKINDIEEEMAAIAEKQAAREARVARLRALVAETEQDSEAFEVSQAAAERKSARREKYQS
ncbi:hypothetical protein NQ314_021013 [Rhamnusium bicolor]|uniref:Uncharacterized protein n=1 Tax=Rhamnusium bicolor TaxID=1586634 RepID=A0AAV8WIN7_9CUCU|nr:hypothetical protein NQ314_021013 [Rhamnusium bicolor]